MAFAPRGRRGQLLVAAALAVLAAPGRAEPPTYVLGVIPQAPPVVMHQSWSPLVERISALAGVPLRLKLYEDTAEFERDLAAGGPDLIFAHPAMVADAHVRQGYLPLVRDRRRISALLFVRKDSPYHGLRDLEGRSIAFVGGRSYCAILVGAMIARDRDRVRFDSQRVGSGENVVRAVLLGKADAGATLDISVEAQPEEVRESLRTILSAPPTASHPIAAHPRVPAEVRGRIAAAVLELARTEADRALLARIRMPDPEPADYDRDYRDLERLR